MKKHHNLALTLLAIVAGLLILPIILTILYSFFSPEEISNFLASRERYDERFMEIKLVPRMFSLDQYWTVMIEDIRILRYYYNSAIYTLMILAGQTMIIPALAYAISRFRFPGRDILSFLIVILLVLPFQVTMIPSAMMLRNLGLMDTLWSLILPALASPFYIFLIRQNMISIPDELFEAAQIDGAGPIRCFFHIALPVSRAILGAAAALSFADCWNMVDQPLIFLPNQEQLHPLSVAFNQLSKESTGIEFAGAALFILPALLIYVFFQDDILTGIQISDLR